MKKYLVLAFASFVFSSATYASLTVDDATTSLNVTNTSYNLTTYGASGDWIRWLEPGSNGSAASPSSYDHSSTGGSSISTYTTLAGSPIQIANSPSDTGGNTFSWTNGTTYTNSSSAVGNLGYVYSNNFSTGDKFSFTITALATSGYVTVWAVNYNTNLTMTAAGYNSGNVLQDSGTGSWTNAGFTSNARFGVFTYAYSGASAGDYIKVTLTQNTATGITPNVGLYAASVSPTAVPEPATYLLVGFGGFAILLARRRLCSAR